MAQIPENKKIVIEVYEGLFNRKDLSLIDKYILPNYKQHNPTVPDGADGLRSALEGMFASFPTFHVHVKRVIGEGDMVVLHNHWKMNPDDRGSAVVDIFRLEDGRLAEHWDIIQEIPKAAANPNGMF